jgi:hypothetical protein
MEKATIQKTQAIKWVTERQHSEFKHKGWEVVDNEDICTKAIAPFLNFIYNEIEKSRNSEEKYYGEKAQ